MPRERGAHCDRDHFLAVAQCGLDLGMKEGTFCSVGSGESLPPISLFLPSIPSWTYLSFGFFGAQSLSSPSLSSGQATAQAGKGHQKDQGEAEGLAGDRPRRQ